MDLTTGAQASLPAYAACGVHPDPATGATAGAQASSLHCVRQDADAEATGVPGMELSYDGYGREI